MPCTFFLVLIFDSAYQYFPHCDVVIFLLSHSSTHPPHSLPLFHKPKYINAHISQPRQYTNQPACFKKKSGVLQLTIPSTQLARSGSASWFTSRSNVSCRMRLGGFQHPGRWWLVPWQVSPPCDVLFALGLTMLISIHTKKVFPDRNMFHKYVFKPELSNIVCTCSTFWIITARN